jgi:hypothetical protein
LDHLKQNDASVTTLKFVTNEEYDNILSSSIVFLDFVDQPAASNTICECIVRNTPVIVNRFASLEEILGEEYPGFYDSLYDAVTTDKIDIVKVLVENGANLELCSGRLNTTPLILAGMRYQNGNKFAMPIIEYLIGKNANWFEPNLPFDIKDMLDDETYKKLIEKYPKQYQNSLAKQKAKKYNI